MKRPNLALIALSILLASCSMVTPYQSEQFGGGYTDLPLAEGKYRVSVRGNGYTNRQRVYNIAQVRAAEIALSSGKTHFVIVDTGEDEKNRTEYSGRYVSNVQNYYAILVIKPVNDASIEGAIDARAKIRELGPLVGYVGPYQ